jgi:transitional endoplasmic reticulum ATPase
MEYPTVSRPRQDGVAADFVSNSKGLRVNTDIFIRDSISRLHPDKTIDAIVVSGCDILAFAQQTGEATVVPDEANGTRQGPMLMMGYNPPNSRLSGSPGNVESQIIFGKYIVTYKGETFAMYLTDGRDGEGAYPTVRVQYLVSSIGDHTASLVEELILAAGIYGNNLHEEIFVYDQGYWQKSSSLFKSISKASWDDVILDEDMKNSLIDDVNHFFDSRATYENLGVPWKRGLIFHGPPGNGKTISIKATMNMLYKRKSGEVPTLYVKSLVNYRGPEQSLNDIFTKARQFAPCYLVFEDLDSLVSDGVRSFFLNQVDGLATNDGILMVGSTNHLERLDPGISKRPSRFDRKYLFPNPDFEQRVQYAEFWRKKVLKDQANSALKGRTVSNEEVEFPEKMCSAAANITNGFSFAYMQEAFLASLLQIATGSGSKWTEKHSKEKRTTHTDDQPIDGWSAVLVNREDAKSGNEDDGDDDDLDKLILWREFKKQVKILKDQIGNKDDEKRTSVIPMRSLVGLASGPGRLA